MILREKVAVTMLVVLGVSLLTVAFFPQEPRGLSDVPVGEHVVHEVTPALYYVPDPAPKEVSA